MPPIPGFPVTTFDSFPLVTKKFIMAKIRLAYHITKNLTASAMYWKQKYDNTDWQTENPGANGEPYTPYMGQIDPGSNRWFFLGAQVPSYDAEHLPGLADLHLLGQRADRAVRTARVPPSGGAGRALFRGRGWSKRTGARRPSVRP